MIGMAVLFKAASTELRKVALIPLADCSLASRVMNRPQARAKKDLSLTQSTKSSETRELLWRQVRTLTSLFLLQKQTRTTRIFIGSEKESLNKWEGSPEKPCFNAVKV